MKKAMKAIMAAMCAFVLGCATEAPPPVIVLPSELIEEMTLKAVSGAMASPRLVRKDGSVAVAKFGGILNKTAVLLDSESINRKILQAVNESGRLLIAGEVEGDLPPTLFMKIEIFQFDRVVVKSIIESKFVIRISLVDIASGLKVYEKQRLVSFRHDKFEQLI